ncbi:phosphomannomutase [Paenirhodobacter populi]|uniref:Phosphomannomutase n=1 Tax=Paenirhodobacter populi TaxID=2306993 RepID=A0A443IT44_9RHOB|nr:phosphomannomutase [Sinirhodobacter populi]RWR10553.1 phosphomannomutase [Sinirhodobacter populi]
MAPKFGTSGLRGLVVELTPELVADYTRAFIRACPTGGTVMVGQDYRPSSPDIAEVVLRTIAAEGITAVDLGTLPTPALALASLTAGAAAIMVTGSHIPADRNGLKFYVPTGEITKHDEGAILSALGQPPAETAPGRIEVRTDAGARYVERYTTAFGDAALAGLRIGVYEHSSVAREILKETLTALGATVVPLGFSDTFIPVDTEAVDPETRALFRGWCAEHGLDALVSTDGDADRPMVTDASGEVIPGDILGALTSRSLGARVLCVPVSANSMIRQMPDFERIVATKIGSPFVIAAMEAQLAADPTAPVAGYEPNGGYLLGFTAQGPAGLLAPLMTRDCLLPIIAPLAAAKAAGLSLADLVAALPPRFTAADRLTEIPTEKAKDFIATLRDDPGPRDAFFAPTGRITSVDLTDGLRLSFADGTVVHLRPSGNAPEFRCYVEADSKQAAAEVLALYLDKLAARLR